MLRRTRPYLLTPPIYDQRVRSVSFFSAALGIPKHFYIFVPPDLPAGARAPAVYFLRGHEREWINIKEDPTRDGQNIIDVYEQLRVFDPAYDLPRNMRFIAQNSATNLILRGDATALGQVTWIVGYGPERNEPWQANFYRGEHLVRCLAMRGLANALPHERFADGDHTWRTADAFAELTLPLHNQALRSS